MVNEQAEPRAEDDETVPDFDAARATPPPLEMLAADDATVCVDDLCLPPDVER